MGCAIGPKTIQKAKDDLGHIIDMYKKAIAETFLKDDPLKISLKLSFRGDDNGNVDVSTDIDFVTDRIKDGIKSRVNEDQGELFNITVGTKKAEAFNPVPEPAPTYAYIPEDWPSGLAWLVGIDDDTEAAYVVGECTYCDRVVMSTDAYVFEEGTLYCLHCIRVTDAEENQKQQAIREAEWQKTRTNQGLLPEPRNAPAAADEKPPAVGNDGQVGQTVGPGLEDGPWSREIKFNVVADATGMRRCKSCTEKSLAQECWIVIPNIGICEECGAENRRLYIVEVEDWKEDSGIDGVSKSVPLCRKYKPEATCDHVHQIGCEADCCQLCALTACGNRCDPAKGLDEESEG